MAFRKWREITRGYVLRTVLYLLLVASCYLTIFKYEIITDFVSDMQGEPLDECLTLRQNLYHNRYRRSREWNQTLRDTFYKTNGESTAFNQTLQQLMYNMYGEPTEWKQSLRQKMYSKYGGLTEWSQHLYFSNNQANLPYNNYTNTHAMYTYTVHETHIPDRTDDVFMLDIHEQYGGHYTNGGSNFHIRLESRTELDSCYYEDTFNGTYTVECVLLNGCNNIIIELDYVNFDAYRDILSLSSIQRSIYSTVIRTNNSSRLTSTETCKKNRRLEDDVLNMVWQNLSGPWKLSRHGCKPEDVVEPSMPCFCSSRHHLTFVGASHMRYTFDWLLSQCNLLKHDVYRKHGSMTVKNIKFLSNRWVNDIFDKLGTIINSFKPASTQTKMYVLFQFGSHDVCYYPQSQFMSKVSAITEQLTMLQKLINASHHQSNIKLIFFTVMPYPDGPNEHRGFRNSYVSLAASYFMKTTLQEIGNNFEIFDITKLIYPRHNDVVCTNHYICRLDDGEIVGEVGEQMLPYFFRHLCGQLCMWQ